MKIEVTEMRNKFYRHLRNRGYSASYCTSLSNDYSLLPRNADTLLLSAEDMERLYVQMEKRDLSPYRLANIVKMFKRWSAYADIDPPRIKPPPVTARGVTYLTEIEAKRLLYACNDMRDYAMLCVMLYGSLRRSEVVRLRWEDVDLDGGSYRSTPRRRT